MRRSITLPPRQTFDLPPELLPIIFDLTSLYTPSVALPPILSQFPWVLGQVCSSWRRVSRSMRNLWKMKIFLQAARTHSLPPFSFSGSESFLTRAVEVLPNCSQIHLDVKYHKSLTTDLISNRGISNILPLVTELDWAIDVDPGVFRRGSFQGLQRLTFNDNEASVEFMDRPDDQPLLIDCFLVSPKLQDLTIMTVTPLLLYSSFPWSRLHTLELDTRFEPTTFVNHAYWETFAETNRAVGFYSLRELTIRSQSQLFPVFFGLSFPWHQLSSFKVEWTDSPVELSLIAEPLRRTNDLRFLEIIGDETDEEELPLPFSEDNAPNLLRSLQSLTLHYGIPYSMIKPLICGGDLQKFKTDKYLELSDFYHLIEHCSRLSELSIKVEPNYEQDIALALPNSNLVSPLTSLLLSLDIDDDDDPTSSFPTRLVAPQLKKLTIMVDSGRIFPVESTCDLITRSAAKLVYLSCSFSRPRTLTPNESISSLLATLEDAEHVDFSGIIFPPSTLESIASMALLPDVTFLSFGASTPEIVVSTIETRLWNEVASGGIDLTEIKAEIPHAAFMDSVKPWFQTRMRAIESMFGVTCKCNYIRS